MTLSVKIIRRETLTEAAGLTCSFSRERKMSFTLRGKRDCTDTCWREAQWSRL